MELQRRIVFRPIPEPDIPLPFGLRSAGHYRIAPGWRDKPLRKDFVQLFWGIEGKGHMRLDGVDHVLLPNWIFLYYPGDLHETRAETFWEYCWLTLDGPLCQETISALGLPHGSRTVGPCPQDLFVRLIGQMHDISPVGQRENALLAFQVLVQACGTRSSQPGDAPFWLDDALAIMRRDCSDPSLNINRLAERLEIHRTTLSRLFHRSMGISPNHYLQSYRVQKALSLLKETRFTITEIAFRCGFMEADYFSKVIRKATGMSPREFRNR